MTGIKNWIIRNFEVKPDAEIKDLVWLKKRIIANQQIDWSFVDTVEFNVDSIPRKREAIVDFTAKQEVVQKWRNLLSCKKAHSSGKERNMITLLK